MKKLLILYFFLTAINFFPQTLKYEMRGTWIATVKNIDWPSSNNLSTSEQITELVNIFDNLYEAGINTVFFQVRTECDAFYDSNYEPWSYWLTGKQGRAPEPFYDPLKFAIEEAHKRGMEIHAWVNPFRAVKNRDEYFQSKDHISITHPGWILNFGDFKMLDPGIPEVRNYIVKIVLDIVTRYNVDGIHIDDYFYPYSPKIKREDSYSFSKYSSGFYDVDDWRRNNINLLIEKLYSEIKKINKNLKFGVSPFGIVENKFANTRGLNSYNEIYSDPLHWLKTETVDYIIPQLYWEIGNRKADFSSLLKWWSNIVDGRHLYIGHNSSKMMDENYNGSFKEISNQLTLSRSNKNIKGSAFFSSKSIFLNYSGFKDLLEYNYFKTPALVPPMEWIDNIPPEAPTKVNIKKTERGLELNWVKPKKASDGDLCSKFIIYRFKAGEKININDPSKIIYITPDSRNFFIDFTILNGDDLIYVITGVDDNNNESVGFSTARYVAE